MNLFHLLGQVYSLGRPEYGRLGLGQGAEEKSEPARVMGLEAASNVTCGASVSYAVTRDGEKPSECRKGLSDQHSQSVLGCCIIFASINCVNLIWLGPEGKKGCSHLLLVLFITGSVYAWGMGTNLQLGTGEEDDEWSPVKMTGKQLENRAVLMASSGGQHTALLVKDKQES